MALYDAVSDNFRAIFQMYHLISHRFVPFLKYWINNIKPPTVIACFLEESEYSVFTFSKY